MPGPSPGLRRALRGLWAALGLGLVGLSGKSPFQLREHRAGAEFPDPSSGDMPLPAPPSPRSHASVPTFNRGLSSLYLFLQHTLETQLPDSSLAQISSILYPFEILGSFPHPTLLLRDPKSPLPPPGVPPHALLCTMVHGLASYPLAAHEDPISPTAVTQRRCSLPTRGLATEFLDVSAVPSLSLAPRPLLVLFAWV